jgi:hypothetical protein
MWIKKVMDHGLFLAVAATFLWGTHDVLGRYLALWPRSQQFFSALA